jgi:hypothetical protein
MDKLNRLYRVQVVEINPESGTEKEIMDETFTGFALTADCGDGNCCEAIVNDRIIDIAGRIASGEKLNRAARLAGVMLKMKRGFDVNEAEEALLDAIIGKDE